MTGDSLFETGQMHKYWCQHKGESVNALGERTGEAGSLKQWPALTVNERDRSTTGLWFCCPD